MTAAAGSEAELASALSPSRQNRAPELPIFSGRSAITEAASRPFAHSPSLPCPSPRPGAAATHLPRWLLRESTRYEARDRLCVRAARRVGRAGCGLHFPPSSPPDSRLLRTGLLAMAWPGGLHTPLPVMAPIEAPARCPHLGRRYARWFSVPSRPPF